MRIGTARHDRQTASVSPAHGTEPSAGSAAESSSWARSRNTPYELVLVCGALIVVVGSLVLVSLGAMNLLSASRAYTQGEAIWSKGQKDAMLSLCRYVQSRDEKDYFEFEEAIAIPLRSRLIRQQMELPHPDFDEVTRNYAALGIHKRDRIGAAFLFRYFGWTEQMAYAIRLWRDAEIDILELHRMGHAFRHSVVRGTLQPDETAQLLSEIYRINERLTPSEHRFSDALARGSRRLHNFLIASIVLLAAILIVACTLVYLRLFRRVRRSEAQYWHLIDAASEAIVIADADSGNIVGANQKAEKLLGRQTADTHISTLNLLKLNPKVSGNAASLNLSALDGKKHEAQIRTGDGALIEVEFSGTVAKIDGKSLIALIIRDVTAENRAAASVRESERRYRELSEQLRIARDSALDASRAKSQFLANMSHEIRTPMNGVLGMLGLAMEKSTDQEQHDHLRIAYSAGESLLTILNDVLDLSRIEAGKMMLETLDFDLRKCVSDAIRMFDGAARNKEITLTLVYPDQCPSWVRGDPVRLRQVLVNLIGNGVKFTASGGVTVRCSAAENRIRFEVEDTGIGIARDKMGSIFDSFSQADASHTRQFGGSGLGLAITKRLVELMGGQVWAESVEGLGSCFTVELPLESRPPLAAPAAPPREIKPVQLIAPLRILVAEDNLINQKVLCALLTRVGASVEVAATGREAFDAFVRGGFDLILMDIQMPELDGLEATRMIRRFEHTEGRGQRLPVIAVTAHVSEQQHAECLDAGMDAVVTKPVQRDLLLEAIRTVIGYDADPPGSVHAREANA